MAEFVKPDEMLEVVKLERVLSVESEYVMAGAAGYGDRGVIS